MRGSGNWANALQRLRGQSANRARHTVLFVPAPRPAASTYRTARERISRWAMGIGRVATTTHLATGFLVVMVAAVLFLLLGYLGELAAGPPRFGQAAEAVGQTENPNVEQNGVAGVSAPGKLADSERETPSGAAPTEISAVNAAPESGKEPTRQPMPTPTPVGRTAAQHRIEGVPSSKQERNLNCEFTSASDLAKYYGHDLSWQTIFLAVGHDPDGNPNVGFVGSSLSDLPRQLYPNGYGVYAGAIARGLRSLGLDAQAFSGAGFQWLKQRIQADRPVIVWAPFDMLPAELTGWYTTDGTTWVAALRGEHTFTVIGYDERGVYVNDPWYGQARFFTWPVFEQAWNYLGQMAVSVGTDAYE